MTEICDNIHSNLIIQNIDNIVENKRRVSLHNSEQSDDIKHSFQYEWDLNGVSYGLQIFVNKDKQCKMYLQQIDTHNNFSEIKQSKWQSYNPWIQDYNIVENVRGNCSLDIMNSISYDLMIHCSSDLNAHIVTKHFLGHGYLWLKCRYVDNICISLFYPYYGTGFTISESGYIDTYNNYDDQVIRLAENAKKYPTIQWVLDESLNYFRPIINKQLEVLNMAEPITKIILNYVFSC